MTDVNSVTNVVNSVEGKQKLRDEIVLRYMQMFIRKTMALQTKEEARKLDKEVGNSTKNTKSGQSLTYMDKPT